MSWRSKIDRRVALVEALVEDGFGPEEIAEEIGVEPRLAAALVRALSGESIREGAPAIGRFTAAMHDRASNGSGPGA